MTRFRRTGFRAGLALAGCLAGGLLAHGQAQAATSRSGVIGKFNGADEIVESCTTAANYVNLPSMSKIFSISGGASSVVVTFSGSTSLSGSEPFDTGFVRLLIDGQQQTPGEVPFISVGESSQAAAFT